MIKTGLIAAAGRGLRLYPYSTITPKPLFQVGGKSIIENTLEIMRDQLKLEKVYIITGHLGNQIVEKLGDGSAHGIEIEYIHCHNINTGLAQGILQAREYIDSHFCLILGDEFYLQSNHNELIPFDKNDYNAVCIVKITGDTSLIKKNYSVTIENNIITALREKPTIINNNYMGCGTYLFSPLIFDYIEKTPVSRRTSRVELTDVINNMASNEGKVIPFYLRGDYTNVNTYDDINRANYLYRKRYFNTYKTSLIIPAYNEELSIGNVIDEFKGKVDEILVMDGNSSDRTALIARGKGAKVYSRAFAGYGDALKCGMNKAEGDVMILVEADATFRADDLPKIREYMRDADMVVGTRTTKQLIEQGANMDFFLRWGNVFAAKIIELMWITQEPRFTDVGCTYRGIWKEVYLNMRDKLVAKGPEFSPEMMVEILRGRKKIIEIPVSYRPRIGGESKHSGTKIHVIKTGLKMMRLVFKKWLNLM